MENEEEMFEWLDELRESGKINMFGAAEPLAEEFGLEPHDARVVLTKWMNTFSERHPTQ